MSYWHAQSGIIQDFERFEYMNRLCTSQRLSTLTFGYLIGVDSHELRNARDSIFPAKKSRQRTKHDLLHPKTHDDVGAPPCLCHFHLFSMNTPLLLRAF